MKKLTAIAMIPLFVFALAACGTKNSSTNVSTSSGSSPAKVITVIAGTSPTFKNVTFIDTNNKLTGFDIELVREIFKRLPGYQVEFSQAEFKSLLLNLETKKIDFVVNQMEKNPERAQKYLFNKEPYAFWKTRVVVAKDNNSINSIDDLKGKKVITTATSASATLLENYNKEHNNAINIVYQNGAANDQVSQIASGRVDAEIYPDFLLPDQDPQGLLKPVGPILSRSDILYVFRKDDPDEQVLADKIDQVIKEMRADGSLAKLSQDWLKLDMTKPQV
ncbi:MAG: extracellular solute-binding protein family 3 [Bacilli bacterium]|nr:extracellular solute-binding protein family 3 [Bacilli bacterium]